MFKQILVPATGAATDAPVFATALAVSRLFGAHIEFLHARPDPMDVVVGVASADMAGGMATAGLIDAVEEMGAEGEARARAAFAQFQAGEEVDAELTVRVGEEAFWLSEHGRTSDLLVTGRRRGGEEAALGLLQEVLFATGRPLLLVPDAEGDARFGKIAIAWKDTPEAARAVAAAMPFITRATEVLVLSVEEEAGSPAAATSEDSCQRLLATLRRHNPYVALRRIPQGGGKPVDVLLATCDEVQAGLLVMGGYGHSRTREMVFGGFTQQVLRGAGLPVLIAH